jgi:hypothetical protein
MKNILFLLVAMNLLTGCVALVAGAAGATIANPKGAGQIVANTGEAIRGLGEEIQSGSEKKK